MKILFKTELLPVKDYITGKYLEDCREFRMSAVVTMYGKEESFHSSVRVFKDEPPADYAKEMLLTRMISKIVKMYGISHLESIEI